MHADLKREGSGSEVMEEVRRAGASGNSARSMGEQSHRAVGQSHLAVLVLFYDQAQRHLPLLKVREGGMQMHGLRSLVSLIRERVRRTRME